MNKLLTGSIAALAMAIAVPALAADLAPRYAKAPPPAPVMVYNWTGCYIGGNVGGGWARTEQSLVTSRGVAAVANLGTSERSDFVGGGQIGCDYQWPGSNFVVGAQGMADFGNVRSTHIVPTAFPFFPVGSIASNNRLNYTVTATGRIGYLFAPQLLGYVKGGAAWANQDHNVIATLAAPFLLESANSVDRFGWTVGGGLEWMFAPGWSVFGEYNYMDFGRKNVGFVAGPAAAPFFVPSAPSDVVSTRLTVQQALVGVNYKFNWGGPVVAKY
ncbi:MAG TPA: outer membrane beta-barrel protein [Bradyrhizobium sp.]|nr:outer membrane beta-barrel protein [Bradyrhizobium sp.]